ncbi:hypothetical protein [Leuconostoc fallax]|uniref:Uncharacterized protein n=1 Tax=Leuconostoc fallax TaxID=1251 RepID=A0A4R5N7B3_9LACO|nr:hypothetical protein [Leuconostoc fallax]MBU7455182.1 hypothetical protein [Leuconostoc fallax]MCO6183457.1 hypothetical protein [Leuconostoc fallax]TDG67715.1 hypothetical protein C5L23_001514 [Leuconostoc fallax]
MVKNKFNATQFLSSLFHYVRDFNFNHIIFEVNRYKTSVKLVRKSQTYGNAELFYVSADTKAFAPVISQINAAIELAELEGTQQASVKTPDLQREEQIFQFRLREFGHGKYQLDLSI